jgi:hypothetical protein
VREEKARALGRDALWSAHVYSVGLQPGRLPRPLAPIALPDAMALAARLTDDRAHERAARVFRQVWMLGTRARFNAIAGEAIELNAETTAQLASLGWKPTEIQMPLTMAGWNRPPVLSLFFVEIILELLRLQQIELIYTIARVLEWLLKPTRIGISPDTIVALSQSAGRSRSCTKPSTKMILKSPENDPELLTSHIVNRSISEVAEALDPRRWDRCGDLFAETYRVRDSETWPYPKYEPDEPDPGQPWCGLLYERAELPGQAAENILRVKLDRARMTEEEGRACRDDDIQNCLKTVNPAISIQYSLLHNYSYRLGGLEIPGIELRNSGKIVAFELSRAETRICSSKRITYGRLTQWSGGGMWDYGQALSYAAPAVLCLWTEELHLVVPCC